MQEQRAAVRLWHFKINCRFAIAVLQSNTHIHRHMHAHLAASASDICFHLAYSHLSLSSLSKLPFSPSVD